MDNDIPQTERLPWHQRLWLWLISKFSEEYELTVWFVFETEFDDQGNKSHKRTRRTYQLRRILSKSNKKIVGIDVNGMTVEISTVEPFDYELKKIK